MTVRILVGILLFGLGLLTSTLALTATSWAFDSDVISILGALMVLLLIPMWATVFLRQRWPWAPFLCGLVLAVAWGDCLLMLVGMFHLIIRGTHRHALIAAVTGSLVTLGSVVRMCLLPTGRNPFSIIFASTGTDTATGPLPAPPENMSLAVTAVTIVVAVIALGLSLGFGVLIRRTRRMRSVEARADHEAQRNETLSAELARQSERELLARELHDTLSHRLSVISLHSGALEVGSRDDDDVASTASALRHEAHASLEDLRQLVGGVREGTLSQSGPQKERSTPPSLASMRSLPQLVASVQSTGTLVRPTIIIQDVESAPTSFDLAVYRIVQESLTNAMKHAPGAPVTVEVTVSADHGARILVANPVPHSAGGDVPAEAVPPRPTSLPPQVSGADSRPVEPRALSSTGSGAGLEGIRERADMLGGEATIGVRDGGFAVEVALPPFPRKH